MKINKTLLIQTIFLLSSVICLAVFLTHFSLVRFGIYSDGLGYFAPLRSLIFDKDLIVTNEYEYFASTSSYFGGGIRWTDPIPVHSKYTIGMGLALSPFFILGHLCTLVLNFFGQDIPVNGLSWPYELFYCLGSFLFGITGFIICYKGAK